MNSISLTRPRLSGAVAPFSNIWLFLIGTLGCTVSIIDGITRPLNIEAEDSAIDALTYEPYYGAFVFALLLLPLVLLYARKENISFARSLLLWFVLCTAAYTKDFAYMGIPGTRVYVTDVVLLVFLISIFIWPRLRRIRVNKMPLSGIMAFLLAGIVAAIHGLRSGGTLLFVLRDFAIVAYPLFLLVGLFVVESWETIKKIYLFFVLGTVCASVNAISWFVMQPGQRRYTSYGMYLVAAFVGVLVAVLNDKIRRPLGWSALTILAGGILLYNARAAYLAMGVALLVVFLAGVQLGQHQRFIDRLKLLGIFIVVACLILMVALQTKTGEEFVTRSASELVAGMLHSSDDPTSEFRLLAWAEAIRRFSANPLLGEGYGIPFTFDIYDQDPRPHNTYLTVLYKMGILGFVPFAAILIYFFYRSSRVLQRNTEHPEIVMLYALFLGQMVMCVNGAFNHIVESPFSASIFWVCIGVGMRAMRLINRGNSMRAGMQQAAPIS